MAMLSPGRLAWRALIALIYLFLLAPIIVVFIVSFDTRQYLVFPPASYSLGSYIKVLHNSAFVDAFWHSAVVGAIVGAAAVALGALLSIALVRRRFPGQGVVAFFALAPLLVPHIVLAVGLLLVLSPLGLLDSYPGLILAHIGITLPYTVRTVSMSLASVDRRVEEAALVHGAPPATVFFRITVPLIRPGLIAGGVIAFLISFDEATISLFLVQTKVSVLPTQIYHYLEYATDPQIAALSVLLIVISVLMVVVVERSVGLRRVL